MPFRYQGQYYDEETNLCYNRFRYYNPESGTYISKYPIGLAGGFALYAYVKDVNRFVDIFGLTEVLHFENFDKALSKAFEIAKNGMDNVTFTPTKVDPITGTEVEFKGSNGSKIAFDSPHPDMDPKLGHDKPHIGVQNGGKRAMEGQRDII